MKPVLFYMFCGFIVKNSVVYRLA